MPGLEDTMGMVVLAALGLVLAVLVAGIVSMFRGGEFNARWGNHLMRARVALQALAVALILLLVFVIQR